MTSAIESLAFEGNPTTFKEYHRTMQRLFIQLHCVTADHINLVQMEQLTPPPPFELGFVGHFSETLFLPPKHPSAVAWHADLEGNHRAVSEYQSQLSDWLKIRGFPPTGEHPVWLPHVSICRTPFNKHDWEQVFERYPFMCSKIHLYESIGNLRYEPRWSHALVPPIEQIEDNNARDYILRGRNPHEICRHAQAALTFLDTHLLSFFDQKLQPENIEVIKRYLNEALRGANAKWGCPVNSLATIQDLKEKMVIWSGKSASIRALSIFSPLTMSTYLDQKRFH